MSISASLINILDFHTHRISTSNVRADIRFYSHVLPISEPEVNIRFTSWHSWTSQTPDLDIWWNAQLRSVLYINQRSTSVM